MKFDYSKTINEQLPTFDYYKDRYRSYELELINDRKEIERLKNIINEFNKLIENEINESKLEEDYYTFLEQLDFIDSNILKDIRGEKYEREN